MCQASVGLVASYFYSYGYSYVYLEIDGYLEGAVYALPVHQRRPEDLPGGDLRIRMLVDLDAHGDEFVVVLQMGFLGLDGVQDASQSYAPGILRELLGIGNHILGVHVEVAVDLFVRGEGGMQTGPFHQGVFAGTKFEAHLDELIAEVLVGEPSSDGFLEVTELQPPGVWRVIWKRVHPSVNQPIDCDDTKGTRQWLVIASGFRHAK